MKREVFDTQSMFEPGLARHYAMVGFVAALLPILIIAGRLRIEPAVLTVFPQFGLILVGGLLARRIHLNKVATALEVVALFYLQSIAALIFIAIMASVSWPYADAMLDRWDRPWRLTGWPISPSGVRSPNP